MKCKVLREQLLEAVLHAEKNTTKNHTLPVLSCVLLTVAKQTLSITATNLEVGVRYSVPVEDGEDGVVAVSGSVLSHIVSSFASGTTISFEKEKGYLRVFGAEGSSKITLQETEDFPTLPSVDEGSTVTVPAKKIKEAIQAVVYCASTSTIKPELSSVFVHFDGGVLVTAATDSFRLAEKKVPLSAPVESEPFLIPGRSTASLLRVLEQVEKNVSLKVNKHQLSIETDSIYITLRLTAGAFPDYTQIIPKEFVTQATVLVYDFERVLRKATVFADQFNQTTLTVSPKKKQCTIHTKNDIVGETTDILHAAISGEEMEIRFNQKYLIDSLHSITSDSIMIRFSGQSQPAVITPIGEESFLYLVMPMNR